VPGATFKLNKLYLKVTGNLKSFNELPHKFSGIAYNVAAAL
jgi:hypothetical protein